MVKFSEVYRLEFSLEQIKQLEEVLSDSIKLNNFRLYRMTMSLLWKSQGKSYQEIGSFFNLSMRTIQRWISSFLSEGVNFLFLNRFRPRGRKSRLTQKQKEALSAMIDQGPQANGFGTGVWNSALIQELIFAKWGILYNARYLCSLLKKLGFSFQKACFMTDRKSLEEYEKSRKEWQEETWPALLKKAKETNGVILFGDEVSFAMWGSLARTWARTGEQPVTKTKGIRKGSKMFGAIDFFSGKFEYRESLIYSIRTKSLKLLKEEKMETELLKKLKILKNQEYQNLENFLEALRKTIGTENTKKYQTPILKLTETSGRFNADSYIQFLKQLLQKFDGNLILIEDGAPYHRASSVKLFKEENKDRLTIVPFPTFSPDLNPIEKLWKNTKRDATHLKYFQTFEELRSAVIQTFEGYMNEASKVLTVMKKLRLQAGLA